MPSRTPDSSRQSSHPIGMFPGRKPHPNAGKAQRKDGEAGTLGSYFVHDTASARSAQTRGAIQVAAIQNHRARFTSVRLIETPKNPLFISAFTDRSHQFENSSDPRLAALDRAAVNV